MRIETFPSCCFVLLLLLNVQSLVDIAREEAERRKHLEEQGIEARVIEGNGAGLLREGNITTSSEPDQRPRETPSRANPAKSAKSVQNYRSRLQKLDRAIQQNEARLASKHARFNAEKRQSPKLGKSSTLARTQNSLDRLQSEIDELQMKIKQLRDERLEVYEAGKKEGFLPGELEGKGIVP